MIEIKDERERSGSVQIICERGISLITRIILPIFFLFVLFVLLLKRGYLFLKPIKQRLKEVGRPGIGLRVDFGVDILCRYVATRLRIRLR